LSQVTIARLARPRLAYLIPGAATGVSKVAEEVQALGRKALAIDLYRAMEMTSWLPQAEGALAQAEGR
jgi:hypothetical protein